MQRGFPGLEPDDGLARIAVHYGHASIRPVERRERTTYMSNDKGSRVGVIQPVDAQTLLGTRRFVHLQMTLQNVPREPRITLLPTAPAIPAASPVGLGRLALSTASEERATVSRHGRTHLAK
jgi:hypothetical protein